MNQAAKDSCALYLSAEVKMEIRTSPLCRVNRVKHLRWQAETGYLKLSLWLLGSSADYDLGKSGLILTYA